MRKNHQIYRQPKRRIDQPDLKNLDPSVFRLYKDVPCACVFIKAFLYGFRQGSFKYLFFLGGFNETMQMHTVIFQGFPSVIFPRLLSSLMTPVRSLRKRLAQTTMSWVSVKAVFSPRFFWIMETRENIGKIGNQAKNTLTKHNDVIMV